MTYGSMCVITVSTGVHDNKRQNDTQLHKRKIEKQNKPVWWDFWEKNKRKSIFLSYFTWFRHTPPPCLGLENEYLVVGCRFFFFGVHPWLIRFIALKKVSRRFPKRKHVAIPALLTCGDIGVRGSLCVFYCVRVCYYGGDQVSK